MTRLATTAPQPEALALAELHAHAAAACGLLKSMANESRLMILCQLATGEKTVTELQRHVGLSQSALSQHLAILRRENIVTTRRAAQNVFYALASDEAQALMDTLYELYCRSNRAG